MKRALVIYGTTDGQTRKIAEFMGREMRLNGLPTDVLNAEQQHPEPCDYDAVVVLASLHAGGYQRCVKRWVHRHGPVLNTRPSMFVSVCLGVLEQREEAQREVRAIMDRFLAANDWWPDARHVVAGALKWSRYGWLTRLAMLRIVRKAGGDTDTSRDYEYTNWNEVAGIAMQMVDQMEEVTV